MTARGLCGECGTEKALKTDGTVMRHGDPAWPGLNCEGSGQSPICPGDLPDCPKWRHHPVWHTWNPPKETS